MLIDLGRDDINISLKMTRGCPVVLFKLHLLVSTNDSFPPQYGLLTYSTNHLPNILFTYTYTPSDLRYSDQRPVRGHDGQGEAAALVPEDDGRLPGHPL